jgi:hypothetical protein
MMQTLLNQSQSRANQRKSFCVLTGWFMPISQQGASNYNFTKMDNKMSHDVTTFICKENTRIQYTPSNIHRTNPAEQEICTWKNLFLSGIAGLLKTFPIANWCCLTNQTDFTLNMLRPCRQNPVLLAFETLKGSYSFNATPMAPLGTKVLAHHKPN